MKSFLLRVPIIAVLIIILNACKKETIVNEQDYSNPTITTEQATILENNNFQLNAKVVRLNDVEVVEHGFIIQQKISNTQYDSEHKIILNEKANLGSYSATYKPQILPNMEIHIGIIIS